MITRLAEHLVFGNPWIQVFNDDVQFADGTEGTHVRILPTTERPGVVILAIHDDCVGLVRTFRYPIGSHEWGFPRGFGDESDSNPLTAARREFSEELGGTIRDTFMIGYLTPDSGLHDSRVAVVRVNAETRSTATNDPNEVEAIRWVKGPELLHEIQNGDIEDGFTLGAVALALTKGAYPLQTTILPLLHSRTTLSAIRDMTTSIADEIIRGYDIEYDVALQNDLAVSSLRLSGALERPPKEAPLHQLTTYVGASWCDIVRSDVIDRPVKGLRRILKSQSAVARLETLALEEFDLSYPNHGSLPNAAYALTRWYDGAGKIHYRMGSYSRAEASFAKSLSLIDTFSNAAADVELIRPDVTSNHLRARLEARLQTRNSDPDHEESARRQNRAALERSLLMAEEWARDNSILIDQPQDRRSREFARGVSSLLHNMAVSLRTLDPSTALCLSQRSAGISRFLGDDYRLGQSLNQQAQILEKADRHSAVSLYGETLEGSWKRGKRIAQQNLARISEDTDALKRILDFPNESPDGGDAAVDIEYRAYTLSALIAILIKSGTTESEEIGKYELDLARSVRQVVSIPSYKRAYANSVENSYRSAIARKLTRTPTTLGEDPDNRLETLALIEESSARELLDLISRSDLPKQEAPQDGLEDAQFKEDFLRALEALKEETPPAASSDDGRRLAALTLPSPGTEADSSSVLKEVLRRRAEAYDNTFLKNPLDVVAHDPEIGHRIMMFAANNPNTGIIRYFLGAPTHATPDPWLGAFVIRKHTHKVIRVCSLSELQALAQVLLPQDGYACTAPTYLDAGQLWNLVVSPPYSCLDEISARPGTQDHHPLDHLVVVPAGPLFDLPLHVAYKSGHTLGSLHPLSFSVSLTSFLGGRFMLRAQAVDGEDDLAAVITHGTTGTALLSAGWNTQHLHIAGHTPAGLDSVGDGASVCEASRNGIEEVCANKPEFFFMTAHGYYPGSNPELGPYLALDADILTQFDVALNVRLPRNKLAVIGSCLAGQGTALGGGEVAGFVRALMAAGAGVIALPLWQVREDALNDIAGLLLRRSREDASRGESFNAVQTLHEAYHEIAEKEGADSLEFQPLALYL